MQTGKTVSDESETTVNLGEPQIADVSVSGITLEVSAEVSGLPENGTIELMTFKDFQVNNLAVEIEDYRASFDIKKHQRLKLAKPFKIFLGTAQTLRGAFREARNSPDEWLVTGRVFVFGKFKKFGFAFRRVVPLTLNFKLKNPLK